MILPLFVIVLVLGLGGLSVVFLVPAGGGEPRKGKKRKGGAGDLIDSVWSKKELQRKQCDRA